MTTIKAPLDAEEKSIEHLADDINPEDKAPDSLAEATTAPLADDELGGHATQADIKDSNKR